MDTRLRDYNLGIDNFMEHAGAKAIFPMHFWGKFYAVEELIKLPSSIRYKGRIKSIARNGQVFEI